MRTKLRGSRTAPDLRRASGNGVVAHYSACTLFGFGRGAGLSTGANGASGSRYRIITSFCPFAEGLGVITALEALTRIFGCLAVSVCRFRDGPRTGRRDGKRKTVMS